MVVLLLSSSQDVLNLVAVLKWCSLVTSRYHFDPVVVLDCCSDALVKLIGYCSIPVVLLMGHCSNPLDVSDDCKSLTTIGICPNQVSLTKLL